MQWVVESKILKGEGADYSRRCDWPVSCVEELSGGNRGQTAWAEQGASVWGEEEMEKKDGERSSQRFVEENKYINYSQKVSWTCLQAKNGVSRFGKKLKCNGEP